MAVHPTALSAAQQRRLMCGGGGAHDGATTAHDGAVDAPPPLLSLALSGGTSGAKKTPSAIAIAPSATGSFTLAGRQEAAGDSLDGARLSEPFVTSSAKLAGLASGMLSRRRIDETRAGGAAEYEPLGTLGGSPVEDRPRFKLAREAGMGVVDGGAAQPGWPLPWLPARKMKPIDPVAVNASDALAYSHRREAVRNVMRRAWAAYRKHAWGADEIKPVSNRSHDWLRLGATLVDCLDNLWIMGMRQEFAEAREWVATSLHFRASSVSMFETIIRILGGLLSAFELSKDQASVTAPPDLSPISPISQISVFELSKD